MRRGLSKEHNIDFLFLLTAFLMFTFAAVSVLLLAVSSYKGILRRADEDSAARSAMAYVREVVHQNDQKDGIALATFDGISALKIDQQEDYVLYIYYDDGYLKELLTKEDANLTADAGSRVMALKEYSIEYLTDSILKISCVDSQDKTDNMIVAIRSVNQRGQE